MRINYLPHISRFSTKRVAILKTTVGTKDEFQMLALEALYVLME